MRNKLWKQCWKGKVGVTSLTVALILPAPWTARAQAAAPHDALVADHHLLISENPAPSPPPMDPFRLLGTELQKTAKSLNLTLNLRNWILVSQPLQTPPDKYVRLKHFGSWLVGLGGNGCHNTRAQVLIRDSLVPVTFHENNPCSVEKGKWFDKSTQQVFWTARDLDVDHFVPLKNAYITGGWRWSPAKRCLYANFLGNDFHLVPLGASQNRSKAAQDPSGYMPPEKSHRCEYLRNWLLVKSIWRLALTPNEAKAIQEHIHQEECDPEAFRISKSFLEQQRKWIHRNLDLCSSKN